MKHIDTKRNAILELATSDDERERLERAWDALDQIASDQAPRRLRDGFHERLRADRSRAATRPLSQRWLRAAAIFAVGLATGMLLSLLVKGPDEPEPRLATASREIARAALAANRSAAERLAAVHAVGELAGAESTAADRRWTRVALVERILGDPTPAVRLAAIDLLFTVELPAVDIERLAKALPRLGSPIVQLSLLDLLTAEASAETAAAIEALADDPSADETVRRHATHALTLIHKGKAT